jgi:hypothetical protein
MELVIEIYSSETFLQLAFLTPPFLGGDLLRTGIVTSENETFYNYSCNYSHHINRFTVKIYQLFHIA